MEQTSARGCSGTARGDRGQGHVIKGTRTDFFWDSHVGKSDQKDGESQRGNSEGRGECREKQRLKVTRKGKGKGKRLMD